jgi:hypothetical protein
VQATVRFDDLQPGSQPEVEGVAQHDLRAGLDKLHRRHRLDRAVGAHRHEYRRFDDAVRELQAAAPRRAIGGKQVENRAHAARSSSIASP